MTTNETERFGLTPEQLDNLFERTGEQLIAEAEGRRQAAEWPSVVERVIGHLWKRSRGQADALSTINDRLAALEASMGIARD